MNVADHHDPGGARDDSADEKPNSNEESSDTDIAYFLNRHRFEEEFREFYEKTGVTPRQIVQFPVVLPFHLPFPDVTSASYDLTDTETIVQFAFRTLSTTSVFKAGIVSEHEHRIPLHKSHVEMNFVTGATAPLALDEDGLSEIYDTLLLHLNYVITGYLLLHEDPGVHVVTKEMFELVSLARYIPVDAWDEAKSVVFLQNLNAPHRRDDLQKHELERVLWYSHVVREETNPFALSKQMLLSARQALSSGRYQEGAIWAQTAVESFWSRLLVKVLETEQGLDVEDAEARVEDQPFISRVTKQMHPLLGGRWDLTAEDTPVGNWHGQTYKLRNRVVHSGYFPSFTETDAAIAAAEGATQYTLDRLQRNAARFGFLLRYLTPLDEESTAERRT